ncbi:MAG TPA: hypothetical protein VK177_16475 [Flavobacteriales bacterium]|nr:hypothetical protein [Flavobacteriales bacterium]
MENGKKIIYALLLAMVFPFLGNAQNNFGYPEWPMILRHAANNLSTPVKNQLIDFKPAYLGSSSPTVAFIDTTSVDYGGSAVAYDTCGNMLFYLSHTGLYDDGTNDARQLRFIAPDGTEITPDTGRLNCPPRDAEVQVIPLPTFTNRWMIVYNRNFDNTTSDGTYLFQPVLYSIVQYDTSGFTFVTDGSGSIKDRDLNTGLYYDYGKAVSIEYELESQEKVRYLYLKRHENNSNQPEGDNTCQIDQYTITDTGLAIVTGSPLIRSITQEKGYTYFQDVGTAVELNEYTNNNIKLATVFYYEEVDGSSADGHDGSRFLYTTFNNHENFGNVTYTNQELIYCDELAIVPSDDVADITNYDTASWANDWKTSTDFDGINYLQNFPAKISTIEFSPEGKYIYLGAGGFFAGGYTNVTYLAQVDLLHQVTVTHGMSSFQAYPARLKVEQAVGTMNFTNGYGNTFSGVTDVDYQNWHNVGSIEKAPDGKLYFLRGEGTLFCINDPDQPFTNILLTPSDILDSEPGNLTFLTPGVTVSGINMVNAALIPDAIDQQNYIPEYSVCHEIPQEPCENCIGSFAPEAGKKYFISAWVKERNAPATKLSYTYPQIVLNYIGTGQSSGAISPSGYIIDGWQKIDYEFTIPDTTVELDIKLVCITGDCLFDDIRVIPYDGSAKTYVYDPVTLRLAAELDERHYATFYEYDEEGKLMRIKKETERGVMTIQESKTSVPKQ